MEALKRLDNEKLIDVVKNYRKYGYDDDTRNAAISLLNERGWTIEELKMFGHLEDQNYNDALKSYNAFRRNVKIGYVLLIGSLGILSLVFFFFIFLAYRNQQNFYRALRREDESSFLIVSDVFAALLYFHRRDRMKEQLNGIS